jgi:hypothetical protein
MSKINLKIALFMVFLECVLLTKRNVKVKEKSEYLGVCMPFRYQHFKITV